MVGAIRGKRQDMLISAVKSKYPIGFNVLAGKEGRSYARGKTQKQA